MVLPGDVDDDLEAETKEECQKYGDVNKCVIYEVTAIYKQKIK
jgi:splicing factor 45